jgi:hypothetical protein
VPNPETQQTQAFQQLRRVNNLPRRGSYRRKSAEVKARGGEIVNKLPPSGVHRRKSVGHSHSEGVFTGVPASLSLALGVHD